MLPSSASAPSCSVSVSVTPLSDAQRTSSGSSFAATLFATDASVGVDTASDAGELLLAVADGMDDPMIAARAPYDLLIANILAGPLIELAPSFAAASTSTMQSSRTMRIVSPAGPMFFCAPA